MSIAIAISTSIYLSVYTCLWSGGGRGPAQRMGHRTSQKSAIAVSDSGPANVYSAIPTRVDRLF